MFMWRRRFPWPDITALCSGKVRPEGLRLTGGRMERYAQQEGKRGFFITMTKVLSPSGLVGNQTWVFRVRGTNPWPVSDPKTSKKWQDPRTIQAKLGQWMFLVPRITANADR